MTFRDAFEKKRELVPFDPRVTVEHIECLKCKDTQLIPSPYRQTMIRCDACFKCFHCKGNLGGHYTLYDRPRGRKAYYCHRCMPLPLEEYF